MGCNRFYNNIFINIILIALSCMALLYFLTETNKLATTVLFGLLIILLTGRLIYYVNRTNRILSTFLIYLQENDPSIAYTSKHIDKNFRGLNLSLQNIIKDLKETRIEKEIQAQYLQTILENVNAGIITYDNNAKVELINNAAKKFLNIRQLGEISELSQIYPGLAEKLLGLRPGEQLIEKVTGNGRLYHLSIKATVIRSQGEQKTIITIHDIKNELEEQEIDTWKKLIRVINHEIMNSLTPIITLTIAIKNKLLKDKDLKSVHEIKGSDIKDTLSSTAIIEERSKGLIHFINRYQKLTKLPPLQLSDLEILKLFHRIQFLFKEQIETKKIRFYTTVQHQNSIKADARMVEQVLINLFKNAVESLEKIENPVIELSSYLDHDQRIIIAVKDNGIGITEKDLDQIFVPFFTTKETGSGIGLSLCKQIMRLHKGEIIVNSKQGAGTEIRLKF